MAEAGQPSAGMFGRCVWTTAAFTRVALSTTTAPSAILTPGTLYVVCADVAWHMNQGSFAATQVTAAASDLPFAAYEKVYVWCSTLSTDDCVAGIVDAGAGFMYLKAVK